MTQVAMAMAGGRGLFFHTNPVDLADGSRLMDDAQRKRGQVWGAMLLVANQATLSAARDWQLEVRRLDFLARGIAKHDEPWITAFERAGRARMEFLRAARNDLGIAGAGLTEAPRFVDLLAYVREEGSSADADAGGAGPAADQS
jgi:hypothetical protein